MCQRRGVIEIDIAGDQDVVVVAAGPAANGCRPEGSACRDKRERTDKGSRLERDYSLELMLIPVDFASSQDGWKRR